CVRARWLDGHETADTPSALQPAAEVGGPKIGVDYPVRPKFSDDVPSIILWRWCYYYGQESWSRILLPPFRRSASSLVEFHQKSWRRPYEIANSKLPPSERPQ